MTGGKPRGKGKAIVRVTCSHSLFLIAASPTLRFETEAEAKDIHIIGYSDLQARSAYQPVIHEQFGRWIAISATMAAAAPESSASS